MATRKAKPVEEQHEEQPKVESVKMYRVTAEAWYPGNGCIHVPAMREGDTILLDERTKELLLEDMPRGWRIKPE